MTDWDQRPFYPPDYGESQQGEGGVNHNNNCVPTALQRSARTLGAPDREPQEITDKVYGRSYQGGEDIRAVADEICAHWPGNPGYSLSNPNDTLGAVDAAGVAGHPVDALMHCDRNGQIVNYPTGIFHECPVVAHYGRTICLWQSENGAVVTLDQDFFVGSCSGTEAGLLCVWNAVIDAAHVTQPAAGNGAGGKHLNAPVVRSLASRDGLGALDICSDGGVFPWGTMPGLGSLVGTPHNGTVVSGALYEPGGGPVKGYWLLTSDGGVWPYGAAPGLGSLGGIRLNAPAIDIVPGPGSAGYGVKTADGGWWPFGAVPPEGSEA